MYTTGRANRMCKKLLEHRTYGRGRTNITIRIGGAIQLTQQNKLIERTEQVQLICQIKQVEHYEQI